MCNHRHQKRASDPVELELQAIVSHPLWVLGTKLGPARAASTVNHVPPTHLKNKEVKLLEFADSVVFYVENPKEYTD